MVRKSSSLHLPGIVLLRGCRPQISLATVLLLAVLVIRRYRSSFRSLAGAAKMSGWYLERAMPARAETVLTVPIVFGFQDHLVGGRGWCESGK